MHSHIGAVVAILGAALFLIIMDINELVVRLANASKSKVGCNEDFDTGLRAVLDMARTKTGKIDSIHIFARTTQSYHRAIMGAGLKEIGELRILVTCPHTLEEYKLDYFDLKQWSTTEKRKSR